MNRLAALLLCIFVFAAAPARAEIPAELLLKAEKGDAAAQLDVATIYMSSNGATADDKAAIVWLTKAAENGNAEAAYSLGTLYHTGRLVTKNDAEAARWFAKAAATGDAYAQYALAGLYVAGEGVTQSTEEAVKWWAEAADGGHLDAQLKTGTAYLEGKGIKQDFEKAYFWLCFPSEGDVYPGEAQALRARAAEKLKPAKIAALKKQAQDWVARDYRKTKAKAAKGDATAQAEIGALYLRGSGAIKNLKTAEALFKKSSLGGSAEGQFQLGEMLSGYGRWEYKAAFDLFSVAAKHGHEGAAARLGDFYADGTGVDRDDAAAAEWYRAAADHGSPHAMSQLGMMYATGHGVTQDFTEATFWLSLAAGLGNDKHQQQREEVSNALAGPQKEIVKLRLKDWRAKTAPDKK